MSIERLLYIALNDGIEEMQAKPQLLEDFYSKRHFGPAAVAEILEYFQKSPPGVIHHYARENTPIPVWSIVLGNENESTQYLGDEGDFIGVDEDDFDDPNYGANEMASIWTQQHMILTYTLAPHTTIYYYMLCKFLMMRARPFLKSVGCLVDTNFSGGDLAPNPAYLPAHLFVRHFTISVQVDERFVGDKLSEGIRTIDGAHVNNDVTGVDPKVDPLTPDGGGS